MKISSIPINQNYYHNDYHHPHSSNSLQKQSFKGLYDTSLKLLTSEVEEDEAYFNPTTNKPDKLYTMLANMLIDNKFDNVSQILSESIDKNGKVNLAFMRLMPLLVDKNSTTTLGKTVIFLENLLLNLKIKFKKSKIAGFDLQNSDVSKVIYSFKDNDGNFNSKNERCYFKFLSQAGKYYKDHQACSDSIVELVEYAKDENGIVDNKKVKEISSVLNIVPVFEIVSRYFSTLDSIEEDKRDEVLLGFNKLNLSEKYKIYSLLAYANYCLDENYEPVDEKVEYFLKLYNANPKIISTTALECARFGKETQNYIVQEVVPNLKNPDEIDWLYDFLDMFEEDVDGVLELAKNYREICGTFEGLEELAYSCMSDFHKTEEANEEDNIFLVDYFDEALAYLSLQKKYNKGDEINGDLFVEILSGDFRPEVYPYDTRAQIYNCLTSIINGIEVDNIACDIDISQIKKAILDLENINDEFKNVIPISNEVKKQFISQILSAYEDEYTDFEITLIRSIDSLKALGKSGLPLKYSRNQFISDINALNCSTNDKISILKSMGAIQVSCDELGNIVQFDGILIPNNQKLKNENDRKANEILNKFLFENEVLTNSPELNEHLNLIIKALPEFISVIGKQQHNTQNYSLDVHMLLALGYSVSNVEYFDLKQNERAILKFSALLHDIAKKEAIVDTGHQFLSSEYVDSISSKIFAHPDIKARICEFVCSHHWLAKFNTNKEEAPEVAFHFRRPNDMKMAQIMAKADLMAVGDAFYEKLKYALGNDNLVSVLENNIIFLATTNFYFSNRFVNKNKLKNNIENHNGKDYCVINLKKLNGDDSVSDFGFGYGVSKNDLKLCVHMVDAENIASSLNTVKTITKPANNGVISASIITPEITRTYKDRDHGLLLSYNASNVIAAKDRNLYSGYRKSLSELMDDLVEGGKISKERNSFAALLAHLLGFADREDWLCICADFCEQYLSQITSINQINPECEIELYDIKLTGADLINALEKIQSRLIDYRGVFHNELLIYLPRIEGVISKANDLSQVPKEMLDFAQENNLPVVLI